MIVKIDSTGKDFGSPEFWESVNKIAVHGMYLRIKSSPDILFNVKTSNKMKVEPELFIVGSELEIANIVNLAMSYEFDDKATVQESIIRQENLQNRILDADFELLDTKGHKLFVGCLSAITEIEKHKTESGLFNLAFTISGLRSFPATSKIMTVKIEDTEIRNQAHLMDAEGTSDAETKPLEADIIKLLAEKGYNATDIDISFDTMQNIWRWCCDITHIFGSDGWKEEFAATTSESETTFIGNEPAIIEVALAETKAKKVEAVNHPNHYGGKDNPYEVIKIIEAWGLDDDFMIGNAFKYIARAGKKDKSKEIEDLKKASFYIDRKIRKLKTTQKSTQPIEGEIEATYLLTNVFEGLKMEGLLKTSIYHIYKTLFCTGELNETYTPDANRLEVELHNLRLALQCVNEHIKKLELEAENK